MKSRNRLLKILAVIAAVVVVGFFAVELYGLTAQSYNTETAYIHTVLETVDAEMFVIRDETLLTSNGSGVTVQLAENGERVSKGSSIAAVFSDEETAKNYVEAESLKKQLDVYKSIDSHLILDNVDMTKLSVEINNEFMAIIDAAYNNNYSEIEDSKLVLNEKISRRQVSLGKTVDCKAKISELTAQIASLESSASFSSIISAQSAGYFVGEADGYEDVLTVADIENLSDEMIRDALDAEQSDVSDNTVGKIINGYNWYVATVMDTGKVVGFDKGKEVKLILGSSDEQTVATKVHSVKAVEGNKSVVVFRCNLMNDELTSLRKVSGKVVINEHTGLRISKDALRFDSDGNAGVYVRRANIVNFRSVNILYTDDNYFVAAAKEGAELAYPHLELYDEVIISGKDLSDGMVIG